MGILVKNIRRIINKNGNIICPNDKCYSEDIIKNDMGIPTELSEIKYDKEIRNYNMYCNNCKQEFMIEVIKNSDDCKRISELVSNLKCKSEIR